MTLIGRLRAQSSFADVHTLVPMRFTVSSADQTDCLDLTYNPQSAGKAGCPTSGLSFSAVWIPSPTWHWVESTTKFMDISEASTGNFTSILIFVPGLWHIDRRDALIERRDHPQQHPNGTAPSYFWRVWARYSAMRPHAQYAVITMPLERLGCQLDRASQSHQNRLRQLYDVSPERPGGEQLCPRVSLGGNYVGSPCCRLGVTARRNEAVLERAPAGWERLDFAALTRAAAVAGREPRTVPLNWHYMCHIKGATPWPKCNTFDDDSPWGPWNRGPSKANRTENLLRSFERCGQFIAKWFQNTANITWEAREGPSGCGEEGNSLFWDYVVRRRSGLNREVTLHAGTRIRSI